jgi:hypothetical protein
VFCFLKLRATAREIGPTLPKYIVAVIINLPTALRLEVRFLERPTVAVALTVSYAISIAETPSVTAARSIVEQNIIKKDVHITETALATVCLAIDLLNTSTLSLFLTDAIAEAIITAKVTVFIPPAVPTGEPPINIRRSDKIEDAFVRFS